MFRAIIMKDPSALCNLGRDFKGKNAVALILSFHHALRYPFDHRSTDLAGLSNRLSMIDSYCYHVMFLVRQDRLCDSPDAAKLFGFRPALDANSRILPNEYCVTPGSHAKRLVEKDQVMEVDIVLSSSKNGSISVRGDMLNKLLRRNLEAVIFDLLHKLHFELTEVTVLRPCFEHVLQNECKRSVCTRLHDTIPSRHTLGMYFRVHMQVVAALEHLWHISCYAFSNNLRKDIQRIWIERTYCVLFPLARAYGDPTLTSTSYPEVGRAVPIVCSWVERRVWDLSPDNQSARFPTDAVLLVMMAYVFNERRLPAYFWHDLRMFHAPSWLYNSRTGGSLVNDMTYLVVTDARCPVEQGADFFAYVSGTS